VSVFLVLSSSSVAFYVFILLALWRDARKQRNRRIVSYSSTDFDEVWGFETDTSDIPSQSSRSKFSDDVLWLPVAKLHLGARRPEKQEPKPVSTAASKTSIR
jgi:hypothetical protein